MVPAREVGTAEGVYGGWGNFGSAAAAFALPLVAGWLGGDDGWRWSIGTVGVVAAVYGLVYLRSVTDTPEGVSYARPRRQGALEVTHRGAVWALAALTVPLAAVLGLVAWRIWREGVITDATLWVPWPRRSWPCWWCRSWRCSGSTGPRWPASTRSRTATRSATSPRCAPPTSPRSGRSWPWSRSCPTFFADTWGLGPAAAGAAASGFAFMNLMARPGGGLLSDVLGSRKRTLTALCAGLVVGYLLMASIGPAWPWVAAVAACMVCSFFVQAGEGAVFAIVPLVKKRVSGQIAGMTGAYGNVGALVFLTVGILTSTRVLFLAMAVAAAGALAASRFVVEPDDSFAAALPVQPVPAVPVLAGVGVAS